MTAKIMEPFDTAQDLLDAPRALGRLRPKDAATLILIRDPRDPHVLMGRRAPGHVFMASRWVFPGGRIDRSDYTAASASEPLPETCDRLERELAACRAPARRARALALTAVRETFEETGLMLARKAPPRSVAGPWRAFRGLGALPDLAPLEYVARAITPPGRARRFDARFFMAPAEALVDSEPTAGSGELDEIAWLPLSHARELDLPAITRFVLAEVAQRLEAPSRPPGHRPLPFVRHARGRSVVSYE